MRLRPAAQGRRRILAAVAAVAALVICGQAITAAPAQAATFAGNYWVFAGNGSASWCLDANTAQGGVNGTRVQVWTCNQQSQQEWAFYRVSGNIYNIVNVRYQRCLDADFNNINQNGDQVQLWLCNGSPWQEWVFPALGEPGPFNFATISCHYNFNVIDADNSRPIGNGSKVQLWTPTGGYNQSWSTSFPL